MLKCRDVAEQSGDYVERQLSLRQRLSIRAHLLMCGHCRRFVAHLRTAIAYFNGWPAEPMSEQEAENIACAVERESLSRPSTS